MIVDNMNENYYHRSDIIIVHQCLLRLGQLNEKKIASIPRKYKLFRRYFERNKKWLMMIDETSNLKREEASTDKSTSTNFDDICKYVFEHIEERQRPLMNLPEPTKHEESALGQLILLGYGRSMKKNGEGMRTTDCSDLIYRFMRVTELIMIRMKQLMSQMS